MSEMDFTAAEKAALLFVLAIFIPVGLFIEYQRPVLATLGLALLGVIAWGGL